VDWQGEEWLHLCGLWHRPFRYIRIQILEVGAPTRCALFLVSVSKMGGGTDEFKGMRPNVAKSRALAIEHVTGRAAAGDEIPV
jgi:hypothetical protein